jgi:glycosyltransferase involved in cell wall biosynthesis
MGKLMRIGIVAFPFDKGKSGLWNYIKSIIENISKLDDKNKYYIFTYYKFNIHKKNFKQILFKSNWVNNPTVNMLWHQTFLPYFVKKYKIDLLHLPAGNRRLVLFKNCKIITTVHDLSQFNVKEKYDVFRMLYVKRILPLLTKKINKIISVSKNTKKDVVKYWKIKEDKISVIPNGIDFFDKLDPKKDNVVLKKYNLKKNFIFYVSRLEHPGKNHIRLIRAYERLRDNINIESQLVFVGSDWSGSKKVYEAAKKSEFSKDIIFLGFVPDEDLPYLYKNSSLFIFPSLYEGFGIPILEAMYYKVPVICSNVSSMPEVLGNCGLSFNPYNVNDIADKMKKILFDSKLRHKFIKRGLERIKLFDWKKIAQRTIEVYRE